MAVHIHTSGTPFSFVHLRRRLVDGIVMALCMQQVIAFARQERETMKLLTVENAKTIKGEKLGYLTGILYLAPAEESGVMNTCQFASEGCKQDCLFTAGRGVFESVYKARVKKTLWLASDRAGFLEQLRRDIVSNVRSAKRQGLTPAVRLNGTSDLAWLPLQLSSEFPDVIFYDYTKLPHPQTRIRANYHLTFSRSESNHADVMDALAHGVNVAMVFDTPRGCSLPRSWNGYKLIDGDIHDLRFLDGYQGSVIGLRAKGKARKDSSSNFVLASDLFTPISRRRAA